MPYFRLLLVYAYRRWINRWAGSPRTRMRTGFMILGYLGGQAGLFILALYFLERLQTSLGSLTEPLAGVILQGLVLVTLFQLTYGIMKSAGARIGQGLDWGLLPATPCPLAIVLLFQVFGRFLGVTAFVALFPGPLAGAFLWWQGAAWPEYLDALAFFLVLSWSSAWGGMLAALLFRGLLLRQRLFRWLEGIFLAFGVAAAAVLVLAATGSIGSTGFFGPEGFADLGFSLAEFSLAGAEAGRNFLGGLAGAVLITALGGYLGPRLFYWGGAGPRRAASRWGKQWLGGWVYPGPLAAFLNKDWRLAWRSPYRAGWLASAVPLGVAWGLFLPRLAETPLQPYLPAFQALLIFLFLGGGVLSLVPVSLAAERSWLLASLPISGRHLLSAKWLSGAAPAVAVALLAMGIFHAVVRVPQIVFWLLALASFQAGYAARMVAASSLDLRRDSAGQTAPFAAGQWGRDLGDLLYLAAGFAAPFLAPKWAYSPLLMLATGFVPLVLLWLSAPEAEKNRKKTFKTFKKEVFGDG